MAQRKERDKLVSNKIKFYLDQSGMNQQELADTVDCNKSHISKIISGKRPCVSLSLAIKICEVLGQHVEEVFNFKPE